MRECPLLVLANKQDLDNAMSSEYVTEQLDLHKLRDRPWREYSITIPHKKCNPLIIRPLFITILLTKKEQISRKFVLDFAHNTKHSHYFLRHGNKGECRVLQC